MKRFVGASLLIILTVSTVSAGARPDIEEARRLIKLGKRSEAIVLLRNIIATDFTNFDATLLLGSTLAIEGTRSESIQLLNHAVQLRPQSATAYNTLGTVLSRFLETSAAENAFEKAIQLDANLAEAHVNLCLLLAQESKWEAAGDHIDRALMLQAGTPAAAYSHYIRATIWASQNQFDRATREFETAVALKPDFAEAWSDLGWARRRMADDSGALKAFERAVTLDQQNALAQYRLGTAYLRQGLPEQAAKHLQEALKRGGPDRATLYNLQLALRNAGRDEEARTLRNQLQSTRRSSQSDNQVALLNAEGMQFEKQGDFDGASVKYRDALDLDPTAAGIRLNYGLALCRLQRWREGIEEIQEVLRIDPDNAAAARALFIAREQATDKSTSAKPQ